MDFSLETIKTPIDKLKASILITRFYFELCNMDDKYLHNQSLSECMKGLKYNSDYECILIIKCKNKFIGIIKFTTSIKEMTWIEWLYIIPSYRNQGIATSVLDIVRSLEENKPLTLVTLTNNEAGLHFYKDYGFKIIGTSKSYGYDITELYYEVSV